MTTNLVIGPFVAGEIPEPLEYQFLDATGTPIDLSGFEASFVVSVGGAGGWLPATVTDAAEGKVTHVWLADEVTRGPNNKGLLHAQFWVDNGTNRYASPQITAVVSKSVEAG